MFDKAEFPIEISNIFNTVFMVPTPIFFTIAHEADIYHKMRLSLNFYFSLGRCIP